MSQPPPSAPPPHDSTAAGPPAAGPASFLAVDYGQRRLGLAVYDAQARWLSPLPELTRGKDLARDLASLRALLTERGLQHVVLGLPLGLDGKPTLSTRRAIHFGQALERALGVPVHAVDERLSSAAGAQALRTLDLAGRDDSQSAKVIAEVYLAAWSHAEEGQTRG